MSDDFNEIPDELMKFFGITDPVVREMEIQGAKDQMLEFIDGLSDEQLNIISRMVGMKRGQDQETWFSGIQQWAGMLYLEQMRRNKAKQFAEVPSA